MLFENTVFSFPVPFQGFYVRGENGGNNAILTRKFLYGLSHIRGHVYTTDYYYLDTDTAYLYVS